MYIYRIIKNTDFPTKMQKLKNQNETKLPICATKIYSIGLFSRSCMYAIYFVVKFYK